MYLSVDASLINYIDNKYFWNSSDAAADIIFTIE